MNTSTPKPRVAVVFGGRSSEHSISCVTASGVLKAIDREAYDVTAIGITRDGEWLCADADPAVWELRDGELPEVVAADDDVRVLLGQHVGRHDLVALGPDAARSVLGSVDVVFPLLHGPYGEDGTLQGLLDLTDVRYVGSGVLSSAVSMDKAMMKAVLAAAGLPIGPYTVILPGEWERDPAVCLDAVAGLGLPVFVKPARAGSSMGITKVSDAAQLEAAIEAARKHDPKVVVEAAVEGREVECGVLGEFGVSEPITSLPAEIEVIGDHDFYDFAAKYLESGSVRLTCPAELPDEVFAGVRQVAAKAFVAMGCEGLARVDVFVTRDWQVIVNELNTMPGFTPFSMFPRMWAATGMDYPTLVDHLLRLALNRPVGLR